MGAKASKGDTARGAGVGGGARGGSLRRVKTAVYYKNMVLAIHEMMANGLITEELNDDMFKTIKDFNMMMLVSPQPLVHEFRGVEGHASIAKKMVENVNQEELRKKLTQQLGRNTYNSLKVNVEKLANMLQLFAGLPSAR